MAAGDDGTVWVGHLQARGAAPDAARQGLSAFDGQQATTYSTTDGLAANQVQAVTTDEDGAVILATKAGLSVFDPQ